MNKKLMAAALATTVTLASATAFADSSTFAGATKDAWLTGKIETAFVLNEHLNPFAIDTDVDNGVVRLRGIVSDDIDRDLAAAVVRGIDGVVDVKNDLTVDWSSSLRVLATSIRYATTSSSILSNSTSSKEVRS